MVIKYLKGTKMNKSVGICGYGWLGKAMHKLFPDAVIYSRSMGTKEEINKCDIVFIGVPTPCIDEGKLDTSIVEECVSWCECPIIIIRSTVNPGDCDKWSKKYNKRLVHNPEYLGETPAHPMLDPRTRPFLILGGDKKDTRKVIELYTTVYNSNISIRQVSFMESEFIKLTENRAVVFKIAQIQELYDVCEASGLDFYTIRDAVYGDDPRFDLWWTFIFPNKRGFNSKCVPKDIYAWCAFAESMGYEPKITQAILEKNKEWINENTRKS